MPKLDLDLRLLRHAQAVAQHRSFSAAAAASQVTQPTLSRSIQALEAQAGMRLFKRTGKGATPTDFGVLFLERARAVTDCLGELERDVLLASGSESSEVCVGLGPYAGSALAPRAVAEFVAGHAQQRVRILMGSPSMLAANLRSGSCEFVIAEGTLLQIERGVEVIESFAPLSAYLVVRARHPLAARARVTPEQTFQYPYVQASRVPPRVLRTMLEAQGQPARAGGRPHPAERVAQPLLSIECPTVEMTMEVVLRTDAVTIAPLVAVAEHLEAGRMRLLMTKAWVQSSFGVARLRGRPLSPVAGALLAALSRANDAVLLDSAALEKRWTRGARSVSKRG